MTDITPQKVRELLSETNDWEIGIFGSVVIGRPNLALIAATPDIATAYLSLSDQLEAAQQKLRRLKVLALKWDEWPHSQIGKIVLDVLDS